MRSKEKIQIRDFGAGFSGRRFMEQSVGFVTQRSAKQPRYARVLFRLVKHLQVKSVLELGTSVGISSLYMSAAGAKVVT
ncbi:MAG: hypothetical protein ACK55I_07030, partial [bacterium]